METLYLEGVLLWLGRLNEEFFFYLRFIKNTTNTITFSTATKTLLFSFFFPKILFDGIEEEKE